jgi:hypothetical protein
MATITFFLVAPFAIALLAWLVGFIRNGWGI